MNILGVGPFELLLVLVLGLIVLGPERLQSMGRTAGKLVAQLMAWQAQSPEAQLVQQIRDDFQQEITSLRDELVQAKRQLNIEREMAGLNPQADLKSMMNAAKRKDLPPARDITTGETTAPTGDGAADALPAVEHGNTGGADVGNPVATPPAADAATDAAADTATDAVTDAAAEAVEEAAAPRSFSYAQDERAVSRSIQPPGLRNNGTVSRAEYMAMTAQLQALVRELDDLKSQLQARGVLPNGVPAQAAPQEPELATTPQAVSHDT